MRHLVEILTAALRRGWIGVVSMGWTAVGPRASTPSVAAAVGGFGVLVGVAWAWSPSAWFDEAATLSAVRRPRGELLDLVAHVDAVHGLYYLVAQGWANVVGDSVTSLRL